jgi:hypothetical protein
VKEGLEISQRLEALEALLRGRGEVAWADRLDAAVVGGATGTETLFRAGAVLRDLANSEDSKRVGCRDEARSLRGLIDRQLRRGL